MSSLEGLVLGRGVPGFSRIDERGPESFWKDLEQIPSKLQFDRFDFLILRPCGDLGTLNESLRRKILLFPGLKIVETHPEVLSDSRRFFDELKQLDFHLVLPHFFSSQREEFKWSQQSFLEQEIDRSRNPYLKVLNLSGGFIPGKVLVGRPNTTSMKIGWLESPPQDSLCKKLEANAFVVERVANRKNLKGYRAVLLGSDRPHKNSVAFEVWSQGVPLIASEAALGGIAWPNRHFLKADSELSKSLGELETLGKVIRYSREEILENPFYSSSFFQREFEYWIHQGLGSLGLYQKSRHYDAFHLDWIRVSDQVERFYNKHLHARLNPRTHWDRLPKPMKALLKPVLKPVLSPLMMRRLLK